VVKRRGCGVDHSFPYRAKIKERVELYLYSRSGPFSPVLRWPLCLRSNTNLYSANISNGDCAGSEI